MVAFKRTEDTSRPELRLMKPVARSDLLRAVERSLAG